MAELDLTDRRILNALQGSLPISETPFAAAAEAAGVPEAELLRRAAALRAAGVLRHLSPIFDVFRIGYKSALIAFAVEPARLDEAAAAVSAHAGVSHNYAREHRFNLWAVLALPREQDFEATVAELARRAGALTYHVLPALRLFKIAVAYDMVGQKTDARPRERAARPARRELTPEERAIVRACQDDLPLVHRPWAGAAGALAMSEAALVERLQGLERDGILRRMAAVLRHQEAGFSENGMVCWRVPEGQIEAAGEALAADARVSHCYWRPTFPDWPYPLFSMVHCATRGEVAAIAAELAARIGVAAGDYAILWSAREYKKERVRYFTDAAEGVPAG